MVREPAVLSVCGRGAWPWPNESVDDGHPLPLHRQVMHLANLAVVNRPSILFNSDHVWGAKPPESLVENRKGVNSVGLQRNNTGIVGRHRPRQLVAVAAVGNRQVCPLVALFESCGRSEDDWSFRSRCTAANDSGKNGAEAEMGELGHARDAATSEASDRR